MVMKKKSYVFVGASYRGRIMFMEPMKERFFDVCEMRGIYDINKGRAEMFAAEFDMPVFYDFESMVLKTKPDFVIVTTVDAFHAQYIVKALEMGCDVISEKPMTIDAEGCNAVTDAEKRTGKRVIVTFNLRFSPFATAIKKLLNSGKIGDIFSVHFEWMLDRNMEISAHGTSYFRRWNSRMEKSGGLLVHKSTHHFDLVNWFIGQKPQTVAAFGKLNLYGKNGSEKYFNGMKGKNCRNCDYSKECPFFYTMTDLEERMYAANEHYDGYYKDGCVFASDINIYDTMSVNVQYDRGALLTYSLNATAAYEGWQMSINGSKGRFEAFLPSTGLYSNGSYNSIKIYDLSNNLTEHHIAKIDGGHGGSDEQLQKMLFLENQPDPLGYLAGSEEGAASLIIGAAANISINENRTINIKDLIKFKGA